MTKDGYKMIANGLDVRQMARPLLSVFWLASVLLCGCAEQRIRDEASAKLKDGNYEAAVQLLNDGLQQYPESPTLRAGVNLTKAEAIDRLTSEAAQLRMSGSFDQAEKVLNRALVISSGNQRIQDLLFDIKLARKQRSVSIEVNDLIAHGNKELALRKLELAVRESPKQSDLAVLLRRLQLEQRLESNTTFGLSEVRPITLDFKNAPLSLVLDAITRGSGVNFVLDKEVRLEGRTTVYLRNARVSDAIDLVTSANQLARNIVDANTVFIYPNTVEKKREHQEQVLRVFYLANSSAQTTAALLRSMLRIKDPFVDERANMLAIRESPEVVALAERLVALHDVGEPEVMLELEVMEVSRTVLNNLGLDFPNNISFSPLAEAGANGLTISSLRSLNEGRVGVSMPNLVLNLRREIGDTNILASPKIRAKNKEKAHILIGDKIPIITSTSGATGFVSQSVNYQDVGLKLDVDPVISPDDDVTIKLALEVSTLGNAVTTSSGSIAYQIGTRNASTVLQLRDGETQLLAGLVNKQDASNAHRFPGLGDLPIAGRLFSSQRDDNSRTELVLAVTPRILRSAPSPGIDQAQMWVGSELYTRTLLPPEQRSIGGSVQRSSRPTQTGKLLTLDTASAGATPNALSEQIAPRWKGPEQVAVGEEFVATLQLDARSPLKGASLEVNYSSNELEIVEIKEGDLFHQDGGQTSFTQSINSSSGRAGVGILRSDSSGISGRGSVIEVRARARVNGVVQLQLSSLQPLGLGIPFLLGEKPTFKIQVK